MIATAPITDRPPLTRATPTTEKLIWGFNYALKMAAAARQHGLLEAAAVYDRMANAFADELLQRPDYLARIAEGGDE